MKSLRWIALFTLAACQSDKVDSAVAESADTGEIEQPERTEQCAPELKVDGTPIENLPAPMPGDSWYVLMYCDGALQIGTYILQADPPERVSIDSEEPIVTFLSEGMVTLDYRMGSKRASVELQIGG